jgi:hypothetical protein
MVMQLQQRRDVMGLVAIITITPVVIIVIATTVTRGETATLALASLRLALPVRG